MTDNLKENTNGQCESREIKFRAWDKVCDNMYYFDIYDLERSIPYIYRDKVESERNITLPPRREYIMQYTGLKDKNGVEIYDGDIIKDNVNDCIEIVIFKNGIFGSQSLDKTGRGAMFSEERCYEVMGNIYENPELVSEK